MIAGDYKLFEGFFEFCLIFSESGDHSAELLGYMPVFGHKFQLCVLFKAILKLKYKDYLF